VFPTPKHHFVLPPTCSNRGRHLGIVIPTEAARFSLPRRILARRAAQRRDLLFLAFSANLRVLCVIFFFLPDRRYLLAENLLLSAPRLSFSPSLLTTEN
jgi:hypothetical protein